MKKALALIPVLALAGLMLMGVGTAQASSFTAGDLIKLPSISTVYYYGFDGKRHAFPNEPIYFSWYTNFDGVKTITPNEMASITLGKNIVVRPGTNLVKIQSDPKVYAVEPYGVLRHIQTESDAIKLYGADWAKRVIDLNVAFFPDYAIREALQRNPTAYPEGTVYKNLGSNSTVYLWRNNKKLAFTDTIKPESYKYQAKYTVTIGNGFNFGTTTETLTYIRPIIVDVAQTLVEETYTENPESASYKIGDRVKYTGNDPYARVRFNESAAKNSVGTILKVSVSELDGEYLNMKRYLVNFDANISSILRAEPGVPQGHCAWIYEKNLYKVQ
jgi:hypothetical protein